MKTVGYAIVGTGYFGAELGRIMKEQEGAKIVAVLDPENGQTIADELGCDVETDLDTLYSRDDVDAVIVATPNYLHKEPVVKAAEHGVNVFCEKPIALSYQDCDDMVSFAMTIEYGIASKIGGNIYVATKTFDIIDPSFGKNLTIPYAAIDEMTIAIPVVIIAIIKLFPMFLANPKS